MSHYDEVTGISIFIKFIKLFKKSVPRQEIACISQLTYTGLGVLHLVWCRVDIV